MIAGRYFCKTHKLRYLIGIFFITALWGTGLGVSNALPLRTPDNPFHKAIPSPPRKNHPLFHVLQALSKNEVKKARTLLDEILSTTPNLISAVELDGIMLGNSGNLPAAEKRLLQAIKLSSTTRGVHLVLGKLYFMQKKLKKAEELLQLYLKAFPKDVTANLYLGQTFLIQGHARQGIALLEKIDPKSGAQGMQALLLVADLYYERGRLDLAKVRLAQCEFLCQDRPSYHLVKAKIFRAEGKLDQARKLLDALLEKNKNFPELWLELGRLERDQGDLDQAVKSFKRVISNADMENEARYELSLTRFLNNETKAALEELRPLVKKKVSPGVFVLLSQIQASQEHFKKVAKTLDDLNIAFPEFAAGHLLRGKFHLSRNEVEAARAALQKTVKLDPTLSEAWIHLSNIASAKHQMKQAMDILQKGIKFSPDNPELYYYLALLFEHDQDWESGALYYRLALKQNKNYSLAMNNLSLMLVKLQKNIDLAEQMMRKLHALPAHPPLVDGNLGWVLIHNGKVEEGTRLLQQAVNILPENAEFHYFLSVALKKQNHGEASEIELRLARQHGLPSDYQPYHTRKK